MAHDHDHSHGAADHHGHSHGHGQRGHFHGHGKHGHTHGVVDASITTTAQGLWAVKWSFIGLMATAVLQLVVVFISGSIALLADTIHNFGDAATAIPLGIAFLFARRPPSKRFTFGFGRVEDLAALAVVLAITASALVAGYGASPRRVQPPRLAHPGAILPAC